MLDRTDQTLGNYRIVSLLGHGGFADVYLGEHIYLNTQAAIKVLHAQLAPDTMEQFQTEARTIAHLVHPHIVRVHDFGIDNATPFLVMDYAPNGTLRQRHPRGIPLELALIIPYVKQIAGALQYAHDQRLIHRDVKPENILLGAKYEVLLSDFGIATISQTSRSLPTQDISGTIAYMAPEQVQGKPRPASDQYSLAIIAYEWLTGRCPFQGSFAEIATQQIFAAPPSPRALMPTIPQEVEEVLKTALSKNPDTRFARVEAFANALEQASHAEHTVVNILGVAEPFISPPYGQTPSNHPIRSAMPEDAPTYISEFPAHMLPPPPPPTAPAPPWMPPYRPPAEQPATAVVTPGAYGQPPPKQQGVSRRALLIGLFGTAAVAGVGSIAVYMLTHGSPGTNLNGGNNTPVVNNNTPTPTTTTTNPTVTPQPDPTGAGVPVTNTSLVYNGPGNQYTVGWSRDGTHIASAGHSSMIQVWDSTTRSPYFSMDTGASDVYHIAWSPDGTKIASGDHSGNVIIWDATANGNQIIKISAHPGFHANCVSWSPDSSKVVSAGGDKTAKVWDLGGNMITNYALHTNYVNAVAWSHNSARIVSGSGDHTAHVWDANTGQQYRVYSAHTNEVLALAWSPDDARIVSASDDTTAHVWDAGSGNTDFVYSKHTDFVVAVDWSSDGQKIVTGSRDATAQVWSAANGSPIAIFNGHSSEVEGVAWASDSARVASASDDSTVRVWQIP